MSSEFKVKEAIDIAIAHKSPRLSLIGLGLTQIPRKIMEMEWLESLDLSGNPITYFPPELYDLKNLRLLSMNCCKLEGILEIPVFPKAFALFLGNNSIVSIKLKHRAKSEALTFLSLPGNDIEEVDALAFSFPKLKFLNLARNRVNKLSEAFARFQDLNVADLSGNNISFLPSSMKTLKRLKSLHLIDTNFSPAVIQAVQNYNISTSSDFGILEALEGNFPEIFLD